MLQSKIVVVLTESYTNQYDSASWAENVAHAVSLFPRVTPTALLQYLSQSVLTNARWKKVLIAYGIALTRVQYYRRLAAMTEGGSELLKELVNHGHVGWDPEEYPEWLIFEIENNLLIRPNQAQIAKEMLSPTSGGNCVMMLNMGEGKSSVIVPIVATTLATGRHLPRIIVLPALATPMFHILRHKLGGLLDRRVVIMPFSRSIQLSDDQAKGIKSLYEEYLVERTIVLCQPEHILSFDLMGIEQSLDKAQNPKGMFSLPFMFLSMLSFHKSLLATNCA